MSTNATAFDATAAFNSYFGFNRKPFPTRFDSEFFCLNPRYVIIYDYLLAGIRHHQGMMALTGEAGTGKTFMLRKLMQDTGEDVTFVFYNYFTDLDFDDLLCIICEYLDLTTHSSNRLDELNALSEFLNTCFETSKSAALIIDEAHKLDDDVLNQLFTLSGSGFKDGRSLQVLLSGLPLLGEKLRNCKAIHPLMVDIPEKRLEPFTDTEVATFVRHQLQTAGGPNKDLFPQAVLKSIACHARVPRLINKFCDRALRLARENTQTQISPALISEIAEEILLSDSDGYNPLSSLDDSFPPAAPRVSDIRRPVAGPSAKAGVQALPGSNREVMPVILDKPGVSHKAAGRIVVPAPETPKPAAMDGKTRRARHWRNWAASLLIISTAAAGSYALQQRYGLGEIAAGAKQVLGVSQPETIPESANMVNAVETPVLFKEISDAAKQTLKIIASQWPSLTSRMMANAQALKPDTHLPPIEFADMASVELMPVTTDLRKVDVFLESGIDVDLNFLPPPVMEDGLESAAPEHAKLQNEIERLLALAEVSRRDYRLTTPANDSAIYYYRRVLQLDPKNPDARRGFSKVVNAYRNLAQENVRRNQFGRARIFIERGLALAPNNPRLLALLKQVKREAGNHSVSPLPSEPIGNSYIYSQEQGFNRK